MRSAAFLEAERKRRNHISVSVEQRRTLSKLARKAGVILPKVYSMQQASDAITRLEEMLSQPVLEGFSRSTQETHHG